jgi:hypothetical protein
MVIDSQTGQGLSGANVNFTVDNNPANSSNAELSVTSASDGSFSIQNGPTGSFYCIIICTGYFDRISNRLTFDIGYNEVEQQTVVSRPAAGSVRIILTWGAYPYDLDSHLTGPSSTGGRFHVYFYDKAPDSGVDLDVDDVSSYGPETITISTLRNGLYRYSVHNYLDQSTNGGNEIASSPAIVEVYSYQGLLAKYQAPQFSGYGNAWRVFEINVAGGNANITSINNYVQAGAPDDAVTFKGLSKNPKSNILDY